MSLKETLPKFHQTFIPILNVLRDGNTIEYKELSKKVRDKFYSDLPDGALRLQTKSGTNILLDRIGWGKSSLKQGKFLEYPSRGMVKITDKGSMILKKGELSHQELKKDPDYLEYQREKVLDKEKQQTVISTSSDETPQDLIDTGIETIEKEVKLELLDKLKSMDPYEFERVILKLLKKMGYGEYIETSKSRDGGIDGIINQDVLGLERIYIQAKRFDENKVREKDVRNFIGAMSGDTSKGIFVTTSSFHSEAQKKAEDAHHKIVLIDGNNLTDLMYQYGVGVQIKHSYEVKELDEDFFIFD